ncbi:MAG: flagella basal body P-ring formation protein FlgA [Myxococcota bacterium]
MDVPAGEAIEQALVDYVTERCAAVRVEVRWLGLDPARLAPGGRPGFDGDPCQANPTLTLTWAVGADPDRLRVRPDLVVWVPAQVAAHPVAVGGEVEAVPGEARLSDLVGGAWADGAAVAVRELRAGEALTQLNVAAVPDAVTGAIVKVVVTSGSLRIAAEGRLLHGARVGELVRVYNQATDTVLRGVLVSSDTVEL